MGQFQNEGLTLFFCNSKSAYTRIVLVRICASVAGEQEGCHAEKLVVGGMVLPISPKIPVKGKFVF